MNWKPIRENINSILFYGISWITSLIILRIAICNIDTKNIDQTPLIIWYLMLGGLFFLFFPFFKKLKIGKLFEIERDIKNTKEDLSNFKQDVRQSLILLNTNISTLSTINNQIHINIPGLGEIQNAINTLSNQTNPQIENESKETKEELIFEDEDRVLAMTKARVQMEYLLRKILGKRLKLKTSEKDIKYLSLLHLIREFLNEFPQYRYLENSLNYVRRLGNAAAHAQKIPEFQSEEAIELSSRLIGTLKYISEENQNG